MAMTAHAMQGDRERCLAAGMDGYVTKPLRPTELFEVITRLTASAAYPPAMPTPEEEQDILDRKTLWERVAGDADLLREIVELFLADCPERLMELHEALMHQDCTALGRAAHRLKGALGNISANNALAAVRRVETSARAGDVHAATEALARLEDELAPDLSPGRLRWGGALLRSPPYPSLDTARLQWYNPRLYNHNRRSGLFSLWERVVSQGEGLHRDFQERRLCRSHLLRT